MKKINKVTLTNFFHLIFLYWRSKDKTVKTSLVYFFLSIALVIAVVFLNVYFNKLNGMLMDAIQNYDLHTLLHVILICIILFAIFTIFSAYQNYFYALMQIRWRNWLTNYFVTRWLSSRAYYQIETFGSEVDNADQRISDDINELINVFAGLTLGVVQAILSLTTFSVILWSLSTPLDIPLSHGRIFTIHGDMLWFAVIYSLTTTFITFKIGRPLINLSFMQQRFEAFFRFNLMRIRENSEQIALYQAEPFEKQHLQLRFNNIIDNFIAIAKRERLLGLFTNLISIIASFVPTLLALPGYFARKYAMGGIWQIIQAFSVVSTSLNFFISNYTQLAGLTATFKRLQLLLDQSDHTTQANKPSFSAKLQLEYTSCSDLILKNLNLFKPDGIPLLQQLNYTFRQGEHTLVMGRSGIGKSTLLRTIAGIWPFAIGTIYKPNAKIWFIPQKPYLPQGTIYDLMTFPDPTLFDEAAIKETLSLVNMGHLLNNPAPVNWSHALSLGEQQRLAFARVILHKPDWLLLDEATSHLDEPSETALYKLLQQQLPKLTIISVGHRSSLKSLHHQVLTLK